MQEPKASLSLDSRSKVTADPVKRHARHYETNYLIFLVEGYLYRVPVGRLKESEHFKTMLESAHTGGDGEGQSDEHPITLEGISNFEMESFMDVIQVKLFTDEDKLDWKHKSAALHLATMWGFDDIRNGLITFMEKQIDSVDPFDRMETSLKCRVQNWFHPAIQCLCQRAEHLTAAEGERLGFVRLTAIYRLRETYRLSGNNSGGSSYCSYCGGYHCQRGLYNNNQDILSAIQTTPELAFPEM